MGCVNSTASRLVPCHREDQFPKAKVAAMILIVGGILALLASYRVFPIKNNILACVKGKAIAISTVAIGLGSAPLACTRKEPKKTTLPDLEDEVNKRITLSRGIFQTLEDCHSGKISTKAAVSALSEVQSSNPIIQKQLQEALDEIQKKEREELEKILNSLFDCPEYPKAAIARLKEMSPLVRGEKKWDEVQEALDKRLRQRTPSPR